MSQHVLIAYASATGSTVEVAAEIGKTLGAQGFNVDVKPIQDLARLDGENGSGSYQAVLIGSAVQYGHWLPEAVDFVKNNQAALNRMPVALFCVHIRNLGDDEESRRSRLAYLDEVRSLLQPVDEGYFAGRFNRRGAALILPGWLARLVPSMDLRNWKKMRTWADKISQLLPQPG